MPPPPSTISTQLRLLVLLIVQITISRTIFWENVYSVMDAVPATTLIILSDSVSLSAILHSICTKTNPQCSVLISALMECLGITLTLMPKFVRLPVLMIGLRIILPGHVWKNAQPIPLTMPI